MCKTEAKAQTLKQLKPEDRSDLSSVRNEYLFRTPILSDMLLPLLKDKRDEPMLHLMLNIAFFVLPSAVLVYVVNFAGISFWMRRFDIYFCRSRKLSNTAVIAACVGAAAAADEGACAYERGQVWVYAPFFGVPHGVYKLHHVIMHHIENNHELDASSTEKFQRDSWLDFFRYWVRFAFGVWVELPLYCLQTKRWDWGSTLVAGLSSYAFCLWFLAKYVNFTGTFYAFMLPYVVAMTALAFGNWSQHIFVNPEDSLSNFGLTYNCIDNGANKRTFNDGYHAIHHINARLHWSELPSYFLENQDKCKQMTMLEKHIAGGALTFRGVDFFEVGVFTMTKQLDKLAKYYVHLGPEE
eukprot:g30332.t1